MKKKEWGSDFHFMKDAFDEASTDTVHDLIPEGSLYFSGRAALYSLVAFGSKALGWKKIFLPDYYCREVEQFLDPLPIAIVHYDDGPYVTACNALSGNDKADTAFVWVNYFGLRKRPLQQFKSAFLIEDHTHDPFCLSAQRSHADYCFASLRKALPVPAGGILWSPRKRILPPLPAESEAGNCLTFMKLSAMLLKTAYLKEGKGKKDDFRNLFMESEAGFKNQSTNAALPAFGKNLVSKISVRKIREERQKNFWAACKAIENKELLFYKEQDQRISPFGLVLVFESAVKRNVARDAFIQRNVYPAVLWPHQRTPKARDFSDRMLFLPCDCRYDINDMKMLAETINTHNHAEYRYTRH